MAPTHRLCRSLCSFGDVERNVFATLPVNRLQKHGGGIVKPLVVLCGDASLSYRQFYRSIPSGRLSVESSVASSVNPILDGLRKSRNPHPSSRAFSTTRITANLSRPSTSVSSTTASAATKSKALSASEMAQALIERTKTNRDPAALPNYLGRISQWLETVQEGYKTTLWPQEIVKQCEYVSEVLRTVQEAAEKPTTPSEARYLLRWRKDKEMEQLETAALKLKETIVKWDTPLRIAWRWTGGRINWGATILINLIIASIIG